MLLVSLKFTGGLKPKGMGLYAERHGYGEIDARINGLQPGFNATIIDAAV